VSFAALPAPLAEALRSRVERLGYLGEFFQCAANVPDALLAFQQFTEALKRALPERVTELIALTVAVCMQNAYERHQHERLCRRLGFPDAWIHAVEALRGDELSAEDAAVHRLVLALLDRDGHGARTEIEAVIDHLGAPAAVAVVLTVGRYATHSLVVNALELVPPVPSIFADA
jgi:alkylhydroperoxidase/carboxymuconolactone decarboxylase family protein YurZ